MHSEIVKTHSTKYDQLQGALIHEDLILITGLPSVGKTTLAKRALEEDKKSYIYAHVNCNDIATPSKLYIDIARSLRNKLVYKKWKESVPDKIMAASDFVDFYYEFHKVATEKGFYKIFIIIDQIECFKKTIMIDCVITLAMIFNLNLIVITNETALEMLDAIKPASPRLSIQERLYIIELPPWDKSDMIEMILRQPPTRYEEVYEKFVHNIVSIVYLNNTKDFLEIRSFCQENFSKFLEYYKTRVREFHRKHYKENPDLELSDSELEEIHVPNHDMHRILGTFLGSFKEMVRQKDMRSWEHLDLDRKVVFGTSVLIVSVYVAAYTSPSDDKKNFVKFQKRKVSGRAKIDCDDENASKGFTMERLLQIYRGFTNLSKGKSDYEEPDPLDFADSVLSDIQLLEDLNFIQVVAGDGLDSLTRYKISSHISREYVDRLAKQVDLPLDQIYGL